MESEYLKLLQDVQMFGEPHKDRTGVGTKSLFGEQIRCDLMNGFPLLTTKKMPWKNTFHELMWFLSGSTNISDLPVATQPWWTPWASGTGELGPIYGRQFRDARSFIEVGVRHMTQAVQIDQLQEVLRQIADEPYSRRILMTTWNAADVPYMNLPPCHGVVVQFKCYEDGRLSLSMYQRSADLFIGVPVNIASYALLLHMIASVTGRTPYQLIISFGDVHIYSNHVSQVEEQLSRSARPLPILRVDPPDGKTSLAKLLNFTLDHLQLDGYDPHPAIKAEVAV